MKVSIIPFILKKLKQGLGIVQDTDTATQAISQGKYVFWKGSVKKASSAISENDTLSASNLADVTDGALNALNDQIGNKTVSVTPNSNYVKNDSVMTFIRTGNILKVNGYINTASAVPAYSKLYDISNITGIGKNMYAWCGTTKIYLSADGTQIKNETVLSGSATYVIDATFIVA